MKNPARGSDSKVVNWRLERNRTRAKLDGIDFDLEKLLATTQPYELGLVRVEFQTIRRHPAIRLGDTVNDHRYRRSRGLCTPGQIELTVIRVAVNSESKRMGDQWNIRRVEQEEERSKDTSLKIEHRKWSFPLMKPRHWEPPAECVHLGMMSAMRAQLQIIRTKP